MAKKNNSARDSIRFQVMMQAAVLGITPEELTQFYTDIEGLLDVGANDAVATRENATGPTLRETKCIQTQANGLDDASEKTLKLRVQMQDVTKPPMWRELKVPANSHSISYTKQFRPCVDLSMHIYGNSSIGHTILTCRSGFRWIAPIVSVWAWRNGPTMPERTALRLFLQKKVRNSFMCTTLATIGYSETV